ncbi:hypothetical protein BKA83DRAFT_4158230 [Pisolithus microcarpus]|nr:hypothetical protein BKA83DRAFT_4158230 [Pisolithus microcarpus]
MQLSRSFTPFTMARRMLFFDSTLVSAWLILPQPVISTTTMLLSLLMTVYYSPSQSMQLSGITERNGNPSR